MTNLFRLGDFFLHSGAQSNWKIDTDGLEDSDWETLAALIAFRVHFKSVKGIPRGGVKLERALSRYCNPIDTALLIVDDVLTTGHSMEAERQSYYHLTEPDNIIGYVIFSRDATRTGNGSWIKALFTYT